MIKLGVLQGRISKPSNNKIQEFPKNTWKNEFGLLNMLNLNHIEWLVTKNSFKDNPLFTEDLKNYNISSICCDNLIDYHIGYPLFLKDNLEPVCNAAIKNNIKNITIPLLEQSDMNNNTKRKVFMNIFKEYGEKYKELNFTFEMELHPLKQLEIVNLSDNFYITYDVGNMTSCGFDHKYSLYHLHSKINNVHLKNRTFDGKSVPPGSGGNTDFKLIFNILKEYKYDGYYTLQMARENEGDEFDTILKYKNYFLNLLTKMKIIKIHE